jgi:hypothetical protein
MIATIIAALVGLAGVIFGLFKHQAAKIATADAATAKANEQSAIDKLNAVAADQQAVQQAQAKITTATQGRTDIDAQTAAKSDDEVQDELNEKYSR